MEFGNHGSSPGRKKVETVTGYGLLGPGLFFSWELERCCTVIMYAVIRSHIQWLPLPFLHRAVAGVACPSLRQPGSQGSRTQAKLVSFAAHLPQLVSGLCTNLFVVLQASADLGHLVQSSLCLRVRKLLQLPQLLALAIQAVNLLLEIMHHCSQRF